jgi:hypothetical protein
MKYLLKAASASILLVGLSAGPAMAAPILESNSISRVTVPEQGIVLAQFIFGGYTYCWYDDAWNGPGWYWCGYALRRGFGWGGGAGFHGWSHRGFRRGGYAMHGGAMRGGHGGGGHY